MGAAFRLPSSRRRWSLPRAEGRLEAAFTGNHAWFRRNRGSAPVTVTLRTNGAYSNIRRVV